MVSVRPPSSPGSNKSHGQSIFGSKSSNTSRVVLSISTCLIAPEEYFGETMFRLIPIISLLGFAIHTCCAQDKHDESASSGRSIGTWLIGKKRSSGTNAMSDFRLIIRLQQSSPQVSVTGKMHFKKQWTSAIN
jgi:hypothetical protein